MRRTAFCSGFVALATMLASVASANDIEIAQHIAAQLRAQKEAQQLKGFHIGIKVENGTVSMKGQVSSMQQRDLAINIARRAPNAKLVVNELQVIPVTTPGSDASPAATTALAPVTTTLQQPPSALGLTQQSSAPISQTADDEEFAETATAPTE